MKLNLSKTNNGEVVSIPSNNTKAIEELIVDRFTRLNNRITEIHNDMISRLGSLESILKDTLQANKTHFSHTCEIEQVLLQLKKDFETFKVAPMGKSGGQSKETPGNSAVNKNPLPPETKPITSRTPIMTMDKINNMLEIIKTGMSDKKLNGRPLELLIRFFAKLDKGEVKFSDKNTFIQAMKDVWTSFNSSDDARASFKIVAPLHIGKFSELAYECYMASNENQPVKEIPKPAENVVRYNAAHFSAELGISLESITGMNDSVKDAFQKKAFGDLQFDKEFREIYNDIIKYYADNDGIDITQFPEVEQKQYRSYLRHLAKKANDSK